MNTSKCTALILAVLSTAAPSTSWSEGKGQSPGPDKQILHDQIASLKKHLATTGSPMGTWTIDARTQMASLTNLIGVASVTDTKCFGGGCYAKIGRAHV